MAIKTSLTDDDGVCAILTVHAEGKNYAVAAPPWTAVVGNLVEFRVAENMTLVGKVKHLMYCQQFDDVWITVSMFTRIHDAVNIHASVWNDKQKDT